MRQTGEESKERKKEVYKKDDEMREAAKSEGEHSTISFLRKQTEKRKKGKVKRKNRSEIREESYTRRK